MSYGLIRAWKSASEYEQVERFLHATLNVDSNYLSENCTKDIEFVDVVRNQITIGTDELLSHLNERRHSIKGEFKIKDLKIAFADSCEIASFKLASANQELLGLILIEISNGKISLCRFAISEV